MTSGVRDSHANSLDLMARLDESLTQVYLTGRVIKLVYLSPQTAMSLILWDLMSMQAYGKNTHTPYLVKTIVGPLPVRVTKEISDNIFVLGLRP
jgi:hypothetical protein